MQNAIFRVAHDGAKLFQRANEKSNVLVTLSSKQAVARLDSKLDRDWLFVFADTPGEGLYVGFIPRKKLRPIEVETRREESYEPSNRPIAAADTAHIGQRLSPHFLLEEFIYSDRAIKDKIDNTPSEVEVERLKMVAEEMERVRTLLGNKPITVTSGFRSEKVNKLVGGVENSDHRLGYAVDFVCPGFGSPFEICQAIVGSKIMASVDQIIQEKNRWVHISFAPARRQEVLTLFEGAVGGDYKKGLHLGTAYNEVLA